MQHFWADQLFNSYDHDTWDWRQTCSENFIIYLPNPLISVLDNFVLSQQNSEYLLLTLENFLKKALLVVWRERSSMRSNKTYLVYPREDCKLLNILIRVTKKCNSYLNCDLVVDKLASWANMKFRIIHVDFHYLETCVT